MGWKIEDVLDYFRAPTYYEKEHGIEQREWELIEEHEEIRFYQNQKTDGSLTLLLLLKHKQGWYGLIPTKQQYKILTNGVFKGLYQKIEIHNSKVKSIRQTFTRRPNFENPDQEVELDEMYHKILP